nr:hypothetical protein [Tanacetum cinerariifolium]
MPIKNNTPPDPIIFKFCEMTGMSPTNLKQKPVCPKASFGESPVGGKGRKPRRNRHGINIRVSTLGSASAGAGSTFRILQSSKLIGKSRKCIDSPFNSRNGKRVSYVPMDDEISKVLDNLKFGAIAKNLKFQPLDSIQRIPVAKSSGLEPSCDNTSKGVGGNDSCNHAGSRDGIAIAKTGIVEGMAVIREVVVLSLGRMIMLKEFLKNLLVLCLSGVNGFGPTVLSNQYTTDADRFAEKLKQGSKELALKMKYTPIVVSKLENKNKRILFSTDEVYKGGQACSLHLYGFFVGTTIDYRVVRGNLIRTWRVHGIKEITKTSSVLNVWEHVFQYGRVYNIRMLMDKMTKERCLKKDRKLDFARVLVEVSANEELPLVLEIKYPPIGNRPAKVGKLEVKYQWKPPLCTHCKTFGHTTLACKVRPRTEEELAAKEVKVGNIDDHYKSRVEKGNMNDDGFVIVGKGKVGNNYKFVNMGNMKSGMNRSGNGDNLTKVHLKDRNNGSMNKGNSHGGAQRNNDSVKNPKTSSNLCMKNSKPVYAPKLLLMKRWNSVVKMMALMFRKSLVRFGQVSRKRWTYLWKLYQLDPSYENEDIESKVDGIDGFEAVAWNIRGLNNSLNQDQVIELLREDRYSLCGLLETHVKKKQLDRICRRVLGNWNWDSNCSSCVGGTRNIVGWDPNHINLMVIDQSAQVIHCFVESINGDLSFHCSFIYAHIHTVDKRSLWKSPHKYSKSVKDSPWIILGDFNATIDPFEKSSAGSKITTAFNDFRECVADIDMEDIAMSGLKFTWNKRPVSILKMLKKPLRKLSYDQGNLFENVKVLRKELLGIQAALINDPYSSVLSEAEVKCLKDYRATLKDEVSFLRQNSKTIWLKEGDINSKYFLNVVRGKLNRGRIFVVEDMNGDAWSSVRDEVCKGIKEFFKSGKILKKCKELSITNICFDDDLMLFCHGESKSVEATRAKILKVMPFKVGNLPVRYLGVPFISKRLFSNDCQPLIDKIRNRVMDWKNKALSFAGRGKAKIRWSKVCKPKVEGGLGIRKIHYSGISLNTKVDIVENGRWKCPLVLTDEFDGLRAIDPPILNCDRTDKVLWRTNAGRHTNFSVSTIWNNIRECNQEVPWVKFIKLLRCGTSMLRELLEGKRFPFFMIQVTNVGLVMKDDRSNGWLLDIWFWAYVHLMDMKTEMRAGIGIDRSPFGVVSCIGV